MLADAKLVNSEKIRILSEELENIQLKFTKKNTYSRNTKKNLLTRNKYLKI